MMVRINIKEAEDPFRDNYVIVAPGLNEEKEAV